MKNAFLFCSLAWLFASNASHAESSVAAIDAERAALHAQINECLGNPPEADEGFDYECPYHSSVLQDNDRNRPAAAVGRKQTRTEFWYEVPDDEAGESAIRIQLVRQTLYLSDVEIQREYFYRNNALAYYFERDGYAAEEPHQGETHLYFQGNRLIQASPSAARSQATKIRQKAAELARLPQF